MRFLAVFVLVLAGCAYVGGPTSRSPAAPTTPASTTPPAGAPTPTPTAEPTAEPTPTPDGGVQHRAQATAAIQHWTDFMADKPADTIVFIWELTHGGGWRGHGAGEAKGLFLSGMIEATVDLPTDTPPPGEVAWPDGTTEEVPLISAAEAFGAMLVEFRGNESMPACGNCLQVVGATLSTRTALTWHGEAEVPVWQFEFVGRDEPIDPISFVAVRDRVAPNDWDAWPDFHPSTDGAYGMPDDTSITIAFGGGACDRSHTVEAVESDMAVIPIVSSTGSGGDCVAIRVGYALVMQLGAPLGDRAVLDLDSGYPVPVYPQKPPDGLRPG